MTHCRKVVRFCFALRGSISCGRVGSMRYISPREYAELKGLSLGYVYEMMRKGKLAWEPKEMTVKRILWEETDDEAVKLK